MRILLFLNNWAGWRVADWLRRRGEEIVGLFVQPPDDRRFAEEILSAVALPKERIWTANQLRDRNTLMQLANLRPGIGISVFFGFVLKLEVIDLFPLGCINLHPALLPYNRGWHTNVWPIVDGTPAGVTIHYIDPGVDTGDIIAQKEIPVNLTDTGGSLHEKIVRAELQLFKKTWPLIREGKNTRTPQDHFKASSHRKIAIDEISCIQLDRRYRAVDLINILRARTYPPYPSAYYVEDGERKYLRIDLRRRHELNLSETSTIDSFPRAELKEGYMAADLLNMMGLNGQPANQFVVFGHDSGAVYARCYMVDEREFQPSGCPKWMTEQHPLLRAQDAPTTQRHVIR